ncbi:MAG: SprT-like domain-containing protein [Dehalococcoidia bacterium]|nr:SprT-like domain-containing protein [Dehalococcoidia bacterium]
MLQRLRLAPPAGEATRNGVVSGTIDPSQKVDAPGRVAELDEFVNVTLERYAPGMKPLSPMRVSRRMTRTLGSYRPDRRQIALSSRLLAFGEQKHVETVLLHETAHAITHHRDEKASSHGRLFKSVCREMGIEPRRFVNVPIGAWGSRQRYVFTCAACGEALVRKRLVRIARCRCGTRLEVQRAARVAVDHGGQVVRVEGYASPRRR